MDQPAADIFRYGSTEVKTSCHGMASDRHGDRALYTSSRGAPARHLSKLDDAMKDHMKPERRLFVSTSTEMSET